MVPFREVRCEAARDSLGGAYSRSVSLRHDENLASSVPRRSSSCPLHSTQNSTLQILRRRPGTRANSSVRSHPSSSGKSGPSVFGCSSLGGSETSPYSTSLSTASFEAGDLVRMQVRDVVQGGRVISRSMVLQRKTQQPIQFEITEHARDAIAAWKERAHLGAEHYLFPSRRHGGGHITTRQCSRLVKSWVADIGLDSAVYGTHSLRRTKATLIYPADQNLRAVQLLGHTATPSSRVQCAISGSR